MRFLKTGSLKSGFARALVRTDPRILSPLSVPKPSPLVLFFLEFFLFSKACLFSSTFCTTFQHCVLVGSVSRVFPDFLVCSIFFVFSQFPFSKSVILRHGRARFRLIPGSQSERLGGFPGLPCSIQFFCCFFSFPFPKSVSLHHGRARFRLIPGS